MTLKRLRRPADGARSARQARRVLIAEEMAMSLRAKLSAVNSGGSGNEPATTHPFAAGERIRSGRLFLLEMSGGCIHSMKPDGTDRTTILTGCHRPDGIVVDAAAGHIYWTNMGVPALDDGSIERADLDGGNRRVVVPQGVTHTPSRSTSTKTMASFIGAIA